MGHSEGWCERGENSIHPWLTKELVGLQKQFHWAEGLWLSCKSVDERRKRRNKYLEKRRAFKRAVRKANKSYKNQKCTELEDRQSTLGSDKRW